MSSTVKVILIIAAILILAVICACLMTGGLVAIGTYLFTATPSPTVIVPTPFPTITPLPSDTPQPAFTVTPEATPTPKAISPDEGFTLDGVELKVVDARYSLINGGEAGAFYIDPNEGFLLVVAISSNEMEMGFLYDNYWDTTTLVDTAKGKAYIPNWANWSLYDSPTNSGYYLLSFTLSDAPKSAVLYFDEKTAIDVTSILPPMGELDDPWWNTSQTFEVNGFDLKLKSATLSSSYTARDGNFIEKSDPANKILIVQFTSSYKDLTGVSDWDPILVDPNDLYSQIFYTYMTWSTGESSGIGILEYIFEIAPDRSDFVLYIPFENLMDISSAVKAK